MANNKIQVKRTSVSGRTANVTSSGNSQYIDAGELALNMADGILYSSNGSSLITVGANLVNQNISNVLTVKAISANGGNGSSGQVLTTNGTAVYWSAVAGGGGGTNLSLTSNSSTVTINSDTGTDATILAANSTTAGIITTGDQTIAGVKTFTANLSLNSIVTLSSEATTLATVTKTQISSFAVASFRSAKLTVQAYNSVTGEVQISELLVAHNGTTASATEYGVVFTGSLPFVTYDVDILSSNVRLMAINTTSNSTQYKISETLMVA